MLMRETIINFIDAAIPVKWMKEKFDSRKSRKEWKQMDSTAKQIWDEYFEGRLTREQAYEKLVSIPHPYFTMYGNTDFLLDTADRYRETIKREGITHLSQAHAREVAFKQDLIQRNKDTNEWRRKFISHGEEDSP